jgi:hypothetical protein
MGCASATSTDQVGIAAVGPQESRVMREHARALDHLTEPSSPLASSSNEIDTCVSTRLDLPSWFKDSEVLRKSSRPLARQHVSVDAH